MHGQTIILSALVAQTAWQWMLDRGQTLLHAQWPQPTLAGLATLAFWLAGIVLAAGGIRVVANRVRAWLSAEAPAAQSEIAD